MLIFPFHEFILRCNTTRNIKAKKKRKKTEFLLRVNIKLRKVEKNYKKKYKYRGKIIMLQHVMKSMLDCLLQATYRKRSSIK